MAIPLQGTYNPQQQKTPYQSSYSAGQYLQNATPGVSLQGSPNTLQVTSPGSQLQWGSNPNQVSFQTSTSNSPMNNATATTTDPAAAAAAREAARQQALAGQRVDTGVKNITTGGLGSLTEAGTSLNAGARGLITTLGRGAEQLDMNRQNVSLNRIRGIGDLVNSVRQGIKSGATRLSNMNALDSSAAEGIARAYSDFGNKERGNIMNQAELANRDLDVVEKNLFDDYELGVISLDEFADATKLKVSNDVTNKLRELDVEAQDLGVGGRFEVNAVRDQIINDGIDKLMAYDDYLKRERAKISLQNPDQIEAEANRLNMLGRGGPQQFTYSTTPGVNTNPMAAGISQLPLFTRRPEEAIA